MDVDYNLASGNCAAVLKKRYGMKPYTFEVHICDKGIVNVMADDEKKAQDIVDYHLADIKRFIENNWNIFLIAPSDKARLLIDTYKSEGPS